MVRELFEMARSKKACLIFFDEIDAIGGARFDDGAGGDNEVQRTMLELINQLDGFDPRGNIKVTLLYCRGKKEGVNSSVFFPILFNFYQMGAGVQKLPNQVASPVKC